MPNPLHAASPGLGGKINGFIDREARAIAGADAQRMKKKFPASRNAVNKERSRAKREADS